MGSTIAVLIKDILDREARVYVTLHHNDGVAVSTGGDTLTRFNGNNLLMFHDDHTMLRFSQDNIVSIKPDTCGNASYRIVVDYRNTYTGEPMFDRVEYPPEPESDLYTYVNLHFRNGERVAVLFDDEMDWWVVEVFHHDKMVHAETHDVLQVSHITLIDPVAKYIPIEED